MIKKKKRIKKSLKFRYVYSVTSLLQENCDFLEKIHIQYIGMSSELDFCSY